MRVCASDAAPVCVDVTAGEKLKHGTDAPQSADRETETSLIGQFYDPVARAVAPLPS